MTLGEKIMLDIELGDIVEYPILPESIRGVVVEVLTPGSIVIMTDEKYAIGIPISAVTLLKKGSPKTLEYVSVWLQLKGSLT